MSDLWPLHQYSEKTVYNTLYNNNNDARQTRKHERSKTNRKRRRIGMCLHPLPCWCGAAAAGTAACASRGTAGAAAGPPAAAGPGPGRGPAPRSPGAKGPTGSVPEAGAAAAAWPWMLLGTWTGRSRLGHKQGKTQVTQMLDIVTLWCCMCCLHMVFTAYLHTSYLIIVVLGEQTQKAFIESLWVSDTQT